MEEPEGPEVALLVLSAVEAVVADLTVEAVVAALAAQALTLILAPAGAAAAAPSALTLAVEVAQAWRLVVVAMVEMAAVSPEQELAV